MNINTYQITNNIDVSITPSMTTGQGITYQEGAYALVNNI
mgnify:CR=1 FL=1